jgi:hypothetical protein
VGTALWLVWYTDEGLIKRDYPLEQVSHLLKGTPGQQFTILFLPFLGQMFSNNSLAPLPIKAIFRSFVLLLSKILFIYQA